MGIFEKSLKGRGIRFIFSTLPNLTNKEIDIIKQLQKSTDIFKIGKYYTNVEINSVGNDGENTSPPQIKVFCSDAKFNIKTQQAEKLYTDIFYSLYGSVMALSIYAFHKKKVSINEFSLLYRIFPKERSEEFMPLIALPTVGAFLYWSIMFRMNQNKDITEGIQHEADKKKLKSLLVEVDDARPLISQNKDFILKMAEELGLWKPYKTIEDIRRLHAIPLDKAISIGKALDRQATVIWAHFMPLSEKELQVINSYLETLK